MQKLPTLLRLAAVCLLSVSLQAQSGTKLFNETYVHDIRIYFDDPDFWQTLTDNYFFDLDADPNTVNTSLLARVVIDGEEVDSAGVHQKGFFSNWGAGDALKKPLKLDFNAFNNDTRYDGLRSINLQNAFKDPTFMHDVLAYRMLREFGVAAPRTAYANIYLNETYWGLYVMVESVNKTFLKEHFGNNDGNLYKAGFTSLQYSGLNQENYADQFELKTNETENDWSHLVQFLKAINQTPDIRFRDSVRHYLDMESYMKCMALDISVLNWDSHFDHGRNFYLYDNPEDGKFYWIPWDYNLCFGDGYYYDITLLNLRNNPDYDKILPKRVLNNAQLNEEYLQYACELHTNVFKPEKLNPFIDQTKDVIYDAVVEDPNKFYSDPEHFELSLSTGFEVMHVDSFHVQDTVWNGSQWEILDTVFVFEYLEQVPGLKDLIATQHELLQSEIVNDYGVSCISGISDPQALVQLKLWPNPVSEWLIVECPSSGTRISIIDANGRVHLSGIPLNGQLHLPLQQYPPGVYWLKSESAEGSAEKRFVVAR